MISRFALLVLSAVWACGSVQSVTTHTSRLSNGLFPRPHGYAGQLRAVAHLVRADGDRIVSAPEESSGSMVADPKSIGAHPEYIQQTYTNQWSVPTIGLSLAGVLSSGAGVTVAVVDTGVQVDHPRLIGHIGTGYDFVSRTPVVGDPVGGPDSGHGTFVAGLIALIAPSATIMPVRVLDSSGLGDDVDVANGIRYAVDHGANIINLSLGTYGEDKVLESGIAYAIQHHVLVVAASGNDDTSRPHYPAAYGDVVAVCATDSQDHKASFSNYGSYVRLCAPGVDIYSTFDNGAYATGTGTSFAAPIVAGIAALVLQLHPTFAPDQVLEALKQSSTKIDDLNPGFGDMLGEGRVNAARALHK